MALNLPSFLPDPEAAAALRQWLCSPLGRDLLQAEAQLLSGVLDDVFGLQLLQLGEWGASRSVLAHSRTQRQTLVGDAGSAGVDLVAAPGALPVASGSVDAVLLPHTLEFVLDPQSVVREADRVLTGDGQLIVLGFSRCSLWGLRASAARRGFPPGLRQLLPEGRLRDWLALLGYEVQLSMHYLYCRPWDTGGGHRRILRRGLLNPLPAGAWLLRARKRLYTPTPIRPQWARRTWKLSTSTQTAPAAATPAPAAGERC